MKTLHPLIGTSVRNSPVEAVLFQETIMECQGNIVLMSPKASLDDVVPA
jgi:hypothetical protein